ncbi:arginine deiminase [Guggenheimella bovis]
MKPILNVQSDIGKLNRVLLHRPGKELENITPSTMERLLFDDVPYLELAKQEHDIFAGILRGEGVEVVYLEDLVNEALHTKELKDQFLKQYLKEAKVEEKNFQTLYDYLNQFEGRAFVDKVIAGVRESEVPEIKGAKNYLHIDPMPNLYFTRDPFAIVGNGVTIHHMQTETRNRETIFGQYVFDNHPDFKDAPRYYDRNCKHSLEGGDIIVLNDHLLAIGVSQRTDFDGILELANRILPGKENAHILALHIPVKRAFMHLDTVFTMVDYDKFTIHPEVEGPLKIDDITYVDGKLKIEEVSMDLETALKTYLQLDKVDLIRCAGGLGIDAEREQWNDGSNTLAIAPGKVVVYDRNYVTNEILIQHGIELLKMPSADLSRGRGGPRCMSMALNRDPLKK